MNPTNPKADFFFTKAEKWGAEYKKLRSIVLDCPLNEELKWGVPCYTSGNKNVVLIHGFKDYCAILFVKGSLLKDPSGILIQQTENVQAGRQVRFTSLQEISKLEHTLKAYILEAIEVEKAGLKVPHKTTAEFKMPEELIDKLEGIPGLQDAFEALTPGRQRAYILFFAAPKQAATRLSRIDKYTPHILAGKGLND